MIPRILIVDDEDSIRKMLGAYLKKSGYETEGAGDGLEAMKILQDRENEYDLILCDIKMPRMDGIELIKSAKAKGFITPVIVMTGYANVDDAVEVMKQGAFDYLTKPINMQVMLLSVRKAIEYKKALDHSRHMEEENLKYQLELERRVQEQTQTIRALFDFANRLNSLDSLDKILVLILGTIYRFIHSRRISLMLVDPSRQFLIIKKGFGLPHDVVKNTKVKIHESISGKVFQKGKPLFISDMESQGFKKEYSPYNSFISVPLLQASANGTQNVFGIINATNKENNAPFNKSDERILSYIADSSAVAIANQLSEIKLEESYLSTVKALNMAIEAKDPYTRGHSERVAELCVAMAQELNLSKKYADLLGFAGILHDIGKIGIPETIIRKNGDLTTEEYDLIKNHPVVGENMVKDAEFLKDARKIIRQHHERMDGTGYPEGLSGKEICFGARIMAVADAYDGMSTDRPYRQAMDLEEIRRELKKAAGTQFDPKCVEALLTVVNRSKIAA